MGFKPFPLLLPIVKNVPTLIPFGIQVAAVASLSVSGLTIGMKQLGWLQSLELKTYDGLVRLHPDYTVDPRLLVVAITEEDLQRIGQITPGDSILAKAIATLQQYQPQVIGLDLHRSIPKEPGRAELRQALQADNVIVIKKLGDTETGVNQIPPPTGIPDQRIGFNDLLVDPDGIVRRHLLYVRTQGKTYASFALQLALKALAQQNTVPQPSALNSRYMQLGATTFLPLTRTSGAYQTNDPQGYQILLEYRSRHPVSRRVTLSQVLSQSFEPEWVQDKIVLIGTTAPSGKDLFYTPFTAGNEADHRMAGVEIHAQMVTQLLDLAAGDRPLIWYWADWVEWVWLWAWALLGSHLAWKISHPVLLLLSSMGLLTLLSIASFVLLTQQGWVPLVAPGIAAIASIGVVTAYRAQFAQRQQRMVMTLLGQNTSPQIAAALWQARHRLIQSGKLPGQRLTATMLFSDIRGFSGVAEKMEPEALLDWLNEYLAEMAQEVHRHQGIINKFTGDGMLAVFGVPMPRLTTAEVAEDARRAIACALAMGARLEHLNQVWQQRGLKPTQMRIGIFTGLVVVGSLGGKDRLEYGVIGDSVNIAARLESLAKERQTGVCRILIAQDTLQLVEGLFQVEPWGPMELRGKEQWVNIYWVVGHHQTRNGTEFPPPAEPSLKNSDSQAETKARQMNL